MPGALLQFQGQQLRILFSVSGILELALHAGHAVVRIVAEAVGQVLHHVPEYHCVYVLAQHVQKEPVAHFGSAHNHLDRVSSN